MFITRGKTKSRTTPGPSFSCKWTTKDVPTFVVRTNVSVPSGGTQITESDGNNWPPPKGGAMTDYGSEFFTRKTEVVTKQHPFTILNTKAVPGQITYPHEIKGRFWIASGWCADGQLFGDTKDGKWLAPQFPDLSSTRSALEAKGTIAIAACAPTNEIAKAASSVGELLQGVPNVPGAALWKARLRALETLAGGADEFLNGAFAVLPTFSDMTDFYKATHKVDKAIDQFIRDSGRIVRRGFHFPKEVTETETVVGVVASPLGYPPYGSGDNNLYASTSRCFPVWETRRKRIVEREIWFNGAFTYYLPDGFDAHDRKDRIRLTAQLLGANPDLNTLWQLTPWSWAVDWFSNASSFVKNAQTLINYGSVMRYGYVMEKTTVTDTYFAGDKVRDPIAAYAPGYNPPYPRPSPVTLRVTTKKRIQANPFGFGVSWDGLSTFQQAIAAALGITRVVR